MNFKLNTIIIFVKNVEKLKSFYADILGLKIVEEIKSEWLLLNAGSCNIGLHKAGSDFSESGINEYKSFSNTKIVFEIEEDILKVRDRLVKAKVKMREIKTFDNYEYIVCDGEDPEGNVFQIKQRKLSAGD